MVGAHTTASFSVGGKALEKTGRPAPLHSLRAYGPPRLRSGLYDHVAAVLDFDVQAVPIKQQHTEERGAARRVGLDVPRLAVPAAR